jgi:hypothetical protein
LVAVVRSFVVTCLLFAGIWVLAGAGWSLVSAAVAVAVLWPRGNTDTALAEGARRAAGLLRAAARRAAAAPRRSVATGSMTAGVTLVPVGLGMATAWIGVAAAGGLLISLGVLSGWNA